MIGVPTRRQSDFPGVLQRSAKAIFQRRRSELTISLNVILAKLVSKPE
jgi:hypothetical protein